jgi:DNA-binding NarL/FixJ family response regulator
MSALEQINYLKPDIILLDVMMPGIDGFETCHRLKSNPTTRSIPILFMTALSELDHLLRGFNEGAVDYLVKPIRPPEVLVRIDVQLTQMRTIKRAEEVLNNREFSALAINKEAIITWLTPSGASWLSEFANTHSLTNDFDIGQALPTPLIEWANAYLTDHDTITPPLPFESYRVGIEFSCKITPCLHGDEYLLVFEKNSGEWDLAAVRNSLGLTIRETEILMWISRGKTNKEMGIILGSSPRTINKHLEHIFEKLGVTTRTAAVSAVLQRQTNLD